LPKSRKFLVVKVAGGATAQCLALLCALHISIKHKRRFKVQYFPTSTGTYWPFQIGFLLDETEILDVESTIRGLPTENSDLKVGKVIANHPLSRRGVNYEKVLAMLRRLNLEAPLQRLRGQVPIGSSNKMLSKVGRSVKSISGGYPPIIDKEVFNEMDSRFKRADKRSPFSIDEDSPLKNYAVIHIRIGDKRSSFTNPADFGGDGIIDPKAIADVLADQQVHQRLRIFVISDEPEVARELLKSENIDAETNPSSGDIWDDLFFVSQADLFIGSWSQVSQLSSICVINNGGRAFYPSTTHNSRTISWTLPGLNYYVPKFLPRSHPIYDK
jgi:hypothetical protein